MPPRRRKVQAKTRTSPTSKSQSPATPSDDNTSETEASEELVQDKAVCETGNLSVIVEEETTVVKETVTSVCEEVEEVKTTVEDVKTRTTEEEEETFGGTYAPGIKGENKVSTVMSVGGGEEVLRSSGRVTEGAGLLASEAQEEDRVDDGERPHETINTVETPNLEAQDPVEILDVEANSSEDGDNEVDADDLEQGKMPDHAIEGETVHVNRDKGGVLEVSEEKTRSPFSADNKIENTSQNASDDEDADGENDNEDDPSLYMHASLLDSMKQKQFEIFVGGLDKEVVEDDLIQVFGKFGEVLGARIVKHPTTQKSKGFAFIRYATVEQAKKALSELKDGVEVKGKRAGISASQDNDTLYMGNICKTWAKDQVLETLKNYGIEHIEEIYLPEDPKNEGKYRGFALLEFSSHSDAMAAFQKLRMPTAVFGCDRSARVSFAQSSMHPSEEALSQVKTLYVEGLPDSWDDDKLKEHCGLYGEIEKIQLSRNFKNARRKDFGFISFISRESAVACLEGINNAQIGDGENKMRASLAKPQNKGRLAKQGARGGFRVKKNGEQVEGVGHPLIARNRVRSKRTKRKGKSKARNVRDTLSSRSQGKAPDNQEISELHNRQKNKPKHRGAKRARRGGARDQVSRPPKKARGNMHGRPHIASQQSGKSKGNYPFQPDPHGDSYTSAYGGPGSSFQGSSFATSTGPKCQQSDMEPHAGYLTSSAKRSHGSYGHTSNHMNSRGGHLGGSISHPSQPTDYTIYNTYQGQTGHMYQTSGAPYTNDVAFATKTASYPSLGPYPSTVPVYPPATNLLYPPHGPHY